MGVTVFLSAKTLVALMTQQTITVIPVFTYLECDKEVCGWDWGDCGYCASGCKHYPGQQIMLGNQFCEEACNTAKCQYDGLDCVSELYPFPVYVSPTATEPFLGTIESPFRSLSEALAQLQGNYAVVYLLAGTHSLQYTSDGNGSPLAGISALEITIETAICSERSILGCSVDPAVIQLTADLVSLVVTHNLTLRNVEVKGGFPLKSGCAGAETCTYCPVINSDIASATYLNDRGQPIDISTYAEQSLCEPYHNFVLIGMHPEANLTLLNVTFTDIRHQPLALISSTCGNLVLTNVTFRNIIPKKDGLGVIMWIAMTSKEPYFCGSFIYDTGTVELLNNGYELNQDSYAAGFASFSAIYLLSIHSVSFLYNNAYIGEHQTDYTSSLIQVQNSRQIILSDCLFEGNLADTGAGIIVRNELIIPIVNDKGVSREHALVHIWIVRCQFVRNYARVGATFDVYFGEDHQNVVVENCTFVQNVAKELNVLAVISSDVFAYMEFGKTVQLLVNGVKTAVFIPPSYLTFQWAVVTDNRAPCLVSFEHIGVLVLTNCTFERNGEAAPGTAETNWALQGYVDRTTIYASLSPASLTGMQCIDIITSKHILNYTATFSNFTQNYCSLGSPGISIHEGLNNVMLI